MHPMIDLTGMVASQSSTHSPSSMAQAQNAIDGNKDGDYNGGHSCTHTVDGYGDPWWAVDLPGRYMISEVNIYNRLVSSFTRQINHILLFLMECT